MSRPLFAYLFAYFLFATIFLLFLNLVSFIDVHYVGLMDWFMGNYPGLSLVAGFLICIVSLCAMLLVFFIGPAAIELVFRIFRKKKAEEE